MKASPLWGTFFLTALLSTALLSIVSAPAWGGVIAYYGFNSSATTDNSGNGNNLTVSGGATIDTGGGNQAFGAGALSLDGTGFVYRALNDPSFDFGTGDFAVSLFYRREVGGTTRPLIGNGSTANIGSDPLSGFTLNMQDLGGTPDIANLQGSSLTTTAPANPNDILAFSHIVAQRNAGTFELWIDGALVDTQANGIDVNTGMAFAVGAQNVEANGTIADSSDVFSGLIDEVWVFDNALTGTQIAELAANDPPFPIGGGGGGATPEPGTGIVLAGLLCGWLVRLRRIA